mgnify:CR=1 FL=1
MRLLIDEGMVSVRDMSRALRPATLDLGLATALRALIEQTKARKKTYEEVMRTRIEEIMDAPFPILSEDTPIDLASFHLQREEAILVSRKGAIVGILTSADFLNLGLNQ